MEAINHGGIFHRGHNAFSIGAILHFGHKSCLSNCGCLNIEHSLNSKVLFSVLHMLHLEATTERCSLKYVFFKTRQNKHTE